MDQRKPQRAESTQSKREIATSCATGGDKRLAPRKRVQCPMRYRVILVPEAVFQNARIEDISLIGFRFRSQQGLPKRASLLLEVTLPGSVPLRSLAKAAWVKAKPEDGGFETGGIFVEPSTAMRKALAKIILGR